MRQSQVEAKTYHASRGNDIRDPGNHIPGIRPSRGKRDDDSDHLRNDVNHVVALDATDEAVESTPVVENNPDATTTNKHVDDICRSQFLECMLAMIGQTVEVQHLNKNVTKGIFYAASSVTTPEY